MSDFAIVMARLDCDVAKLELERAALLFHAACEGRGSIGATEQGLHEAAKKLGEKRELLADLGGGSR